jgi:hypothetical protein
MNPLELRCQGFHVVSSSQPQIMPTLILKIKISISFKCKYQITITTLLVFVDASEDSITTNDVVTPLNFPTALVEDEKFEETPLYVNVSQQTYKKELSKKVVHT